ncbi:MAG: type III PLP-dependent enzyme domain-containing protein [Mobilitalea sp.]
MEAQICDAIERCGTPAYIYDLNQITKNIITLKAVISTDLHLYYSVKANPNPDVLKCILSHGVGAEVSSLGELKLILSLGFNKDKIVLSGPGKRIDTLRYALHAEVRCIHVESIEEIELIRKICSEDNIKANIAIRINPEKANVSAGMRMTGTASQFGMDWDCVKQFSEELSSDGLVRLIGIQVYNGTQFLDAEDIASNIRQTIEYANKLKQLGVCLEYINFGGGFGVPYYDNEYPLDMDSMKSFISDIQKQNPDVFQDTYCVFESGRYLTCDAGVYVTSILSKKISKGKIFLICDGGSNHHANSAFLGKLFRGNFPINVIHRNTTRERNQETVTITGPLCTPSDVIGREVTLERCLPGDWIVIKKSGAYGLTNSPLLFILQHLPNEIILSDDDIYVSDGLRTICKFLIGDEL